MLENCRTLQEDRRTQMTNVGQLLELRINEATVLCINKFK